MGSSTQAPLLLRQGPVTLTSLAHTTLVVSISVTMIELDFVTVGKCLSGPLLKMLGGSKKCLLFWREATELGDSDALVSGIINAKNTNNKNKPHDSILNRLKTSLFIFSLYYQRNQSVAMKGWQKTAIPLASFIVDETISIEYLVSCVQGIQRFTRPIGHLVLLGLEEFPAGNSWKNLTYTGLCGSTCSDYPYCVSALTQDTKKHS